MIRRPPRSTRTDTLFPYTTLFRSRVTAAELALEQAQARSVAARDLLASYWGGDGQGLEIAGGIERPTGVPSALAGADADVREAAIARASAEAVLEQSRATQDYTVGGGLRFIDRKSVVSGKECVSPCRSRGSRYHSTKNTTDK